MTVLLKVDVYGDWLPYRGNNTTYLTYLYWRREREEGERRRRQMERDQREKSKRNTHLAMNGGGEKEI